MTNSEAQRDSAVMISSAIPSASFWHGIWAPKNTPKDVVAKLNAAVVTALADPMVRERLAGVGREMFPRDQQTPEALRSLHKAEIEKWCPIVKASGIKAQ